DASGLDDCDPLFRSAFTFTHAGFRGLFGKRLIRENANPEFAAALDEARNRYTRRFDLAVGDPRRFHGFQSVIAESQIATAPGFACTPAAHLLSVLHFLGHQHRCVLASLIWPVRPFIAAVFKTFFTLRRQSRV